jgi:hypothetical protein
MTGFDNIPLAIVGFTVLIAIVFWVDAMTRGMRAGKEGWHALLEGRPLAFTVLTFLAVAAGGVVELLPGIIAQDSIKGQAQDKAPYTALELEGRDIYIREGCYNCHSQHGAALRQRGDPLRPQAGARPEPSRGLALRPPVPMG